MTAKYMKLDAYEEMALVDVAKALDCTPEHLYRLIDFESSWNPQIKNKTSSARGLVQFMDATARGIGFTGGSAELIAKYPDRASQLRGPVLRYLKQWAPYKGSAQALYMAVFYPAYRFKDPAVPFPPAVTAANPGIGCAGDYVAFVERKARQQRTA